jgi:hypothetical protein
MSNKFLNIGGQTDLTNGTAIIYARQLGADNLQPSSALKTNSVNEIVSSDLEISDINNLQNTLDNVLTNPYVGTLNVSNLQTDTITNLNTSITNLENKTSNIETGGTNLTNTFTTTQTTFTQDQQLITKKYFDDNNASIPTDIINVNEVKAYGFSDSLTLSSNTGSQSNIEIITQKFGKINLNSDTDLQNDLVIGEDDILTQNHKFLKTDKTPSTLSQDTMNGVIINALSTLLIKRVYIPTSCWTGSDLTKQIGIWNNDGYLINSYTIDKTDLQFSRYYKDIDEELVKGTIYRIGVLMNSGEGHMVFSDSDLDSYILDSNPSGNIYGCFENSSSFIFPSGSSNSTSLNVEFVVQNSFTKNEGVNYFKGGFTIIDNLLGGKLPLQTIIKDDFRGSEIKGNPTESGSITLTNSASAGYVRMGDFTTGSTGSLTYSNIYDMIDTTKILNIKLNCRLDWFSEGFFNVIYDEEGGLTPVYLLKFISPVGNTFPKTFNLEIYNGISLVKTLNFMLILDSRTSFINFEIKHNFNTDLFELYINNFLVGNHTFTSPLTQTLTKMSIGGGNNPTTGSNPFYLKNVNIYKKNANEIPFQISATSTGVVINDLDVVNLQVGGISLPKTTRVRITKTPDRLPTAGNAVYEDEYIRLGWDAATASDLEIQRTPASSQYLSTCYKEASTSSNVISVVNADEIIHIKYFHFCWW